MIQRLSSNNSIKAVAIILALVTALILVLPSFTGCGETTSSNTFTELLNLVPATEANGDDFSFFTLIDYASAYKEAGISRFNTIDELLNQLKDKPRETLLNLPGIGNSFITGYSQYAQNTTINKKYVGYNVGDVDAEIQFGMPPREGVAAIGLFDPAATKNALSNQDEWPLEIVDRYQTEEYSGITIHSWGDGFKTNLKTRLVPPHVDFLGRARPLAVTDKYLFYGASLETVKQMIDASHNKGKSLADLPEYASLVDRLSGLKVYTAILADDSIANLCITSLEGRLTEDGSRQLTEEEKAAIISQMGTPLEKFLTFAAGSGVDEKGRYTIFVIYHENSTDAQKNADLLKQHLESNIVTGYDKPWSEILTETDIKTDGNILVARLYSDSRGLWAGVIYGQDSLLYHEE